MVVAIFDLDNTLLNGDSDHAWGEFLIHKGVAGEEYREGNDRFFQDYQAGRLDMNAYLEFALAPLTRLEMEELEALRQEFLRTVIQPMRLPRAEALLAEHREQGHTLLIMTATNRLVTEPIARILGVDDLLATEVEIKDNCLTGKLAGTPCFQAGKVSRLHTWLHQTGHSLSGSSFYSDSHNDLPLLEAVDHPVAVDPDPSLEATARSRGWSVISLR